MRKHLLLLWPGDKAGSPRMSQKGEKNSTHSQCQFFGEKLFPMACKVQSKKGAPCSKAEQAERRVQRGMQHCLLTGDAGGQDCSLSLSSFLNTPFSFLFFQSAIFKSCVFKTVFILGTIHLLTESVVILQQQRQEFME